MDETNKTSIIAGIVTYNPDLSRLNENVKALIRNNIDRIIIVDNGSNNINSISDYTSSNRKIKLLTNRENKGIAHALNRIFQEATSVNGVKWVLTMDQDSVIQDNLMDEYFRFINQENVMSLTSLRLHRAYDTLAPHIDSETEYVNWCITSGNLVNIDAWRAIGGFDERLFIDMVDYDFCYRLREKSYKILRVNKPLLLHELGKPTKARFAGKEFYVLNHSAFRKYYIARNTIYVKRTYALAKNDISYSSLLHLFIKTLIYEREDKNKKLVNIIRGTIDGLKLKRQTTHLD